MTDLDNSWLDEIIKDAKSIELTSKGGLFYVDYKGEMSWDALRLVMLHETTFERQRLDLAYIHLGDADNRPIHTLCVDYRGLEV